LMTYYEKIRGFLLYGALIPIIFHGRYFKKLDKSVRQSPSNPFLSEAAYTKFRRSEEKILYGRNLTLQQRHKLSILRNYIPRYVVDAIMRGKYINKEGNLIFHPYVEIPLAILCLASSILNIVWLLGISYDLLNTDAALHLRIITIFILGLFIGITTYILGNLALSSTFGYLKYQNRILNAMKI